MRRVLLCEDAHAKEEEDDAVAGRGDCLDGILHRCEALLADVLERIVLGSHPVADQAYDSRPVNIDKQFYVDPDMMATNQWKTSAQRNAE